MPPTTVQPDIYLGSLRIAEPVIALTGLLISFLCFYAWMRLRRKTPMAPPERFFSLFFLLLAISSLIGPFFGHAFNYWAGFPGKAACWTFILLSQAALAQGAIEHTRPLFPSNVYPMLSAINLLALLTAFVFSLFYQSFYWVEAHIAFTMIGLVTTLEAYQFLYKHDPGSRLILLSIPLSALAVLPHLAKWSPSVWFTYWDVGHLLACASLWAILLGAERIIVLEKSKIK
ncbi:MAG: hypothetical protein KDD02_13405 [Phaeodactylibacter sp.]|nr:hypothetical protein [Phaeodactylibacter sp.]MCB9301835.1 hypothetical protein [Lewinellaceae bacterium]